MTKGSKLGKRSIFESTEPSLQVEPPAPAPVQALEPVPAPAPAPTLGRPATHEKWTKVTVVLFDRQIVFLDRLANDIRAKSGAAIRRAEILRALVDALEAAEVDLTTAKSEDALKELLSARLGA